MTHFFSRCGQRGNFELSRNIPVNAAGLGSPETITGRHTKSGQSAYGRKATGRRLPPPWSDLLFRRWLRVARRSLRVTRRRSLLAFLLLLPGAVLLQLCQLL